MLDLPRKTSLVRLVSRCTFLSTQDIGLISVAFAIKSSHRLAVSRFTLSHMVRVSFIIVPSAIESSQSLLLLSATKLFTLEISLTDVAFVAKSSLNLVTSKGKNFMKVHICFVACDVSTCKYTMFTRIQGSIFLKIVRSQMAHKF